MKKLLALILGVGVSFAPAFAQHSGRTRPAPAPRAYYGGGQHTTSHGGTYRGGQGGSNHKGGHYQGPTGTHQYGRHK